MRCEGVWVEGVGVGACGRSKFKVQGSRACGRSRFKVGKSVGSWHISWQLAKGSWQCMSVGVGVRTELRAQGTGNQLAVDSWGLH